ncbi:uncharacterized protein [Paramormyrops kingsleyae]|uniref:uncharacterized protein isoform X5 n=1 Tax=Paramormyrops kingsleyae TaxID=1676925 RepID=UPI003B97CE02
MVAFDEATKPRGGAVEERGENPNKSFRVFIRLCPEERRDPPTDEARGFIKVKRPNQVVVDTGRGHPPQTLEFNAVWDETATQKEVYESAAKPLVESLLHGCNGCVITYSSPASGRSSHSLLGDGGVAGAQRGIVSRAAQDIFSSPEALNYKIRVSFIQVSNEKIYDLLESQSAEVCRIREGGGSVLLEGLTEVEVGSPQGVLQLYRRGAGNRQSGASRGEFAGKSHIIFNITVAMQMPKAESGQEGLLTTCKLTLVDLASSAKVPARCGPIPDVRRGLQVTQENAQEVKMLKRSLTIFGNVHSTKTAEKPKSGQCRRATQLAALTGKRVHPQTCLPPIQHTLAPPSGHGWKRCDELDHKVVLPQLEAGGTQAMRSAKAPRPGEEREGGTSLSRRAGEEKGGGAGVSRRLGEERGGGAGVSGRLGEEKGGGAGVSRRLGEEKVGGAGVSRLPGEEKGGGVSVSRLPGEEKGGGASVSWLPGEEKGGGASVSRLPGEEKGGGASVSRLPGEEKGGGASVSRLPGEEKGGGASVSRLPGEEKGGGASVSRLPGEEKGGGASVSRQPRSRSHSSTLAGNQAVEPSDRDRQARPEVLHSPGISSDCLPPPPAPSATAAAPPMSMDCPNCNRERKIRQEYDRYIVQARRDRDALSQRVQELEASLQRREKAEPPHSSGAAGAWGAAGTQTGETANVSEELFSGGGFVLLPRDDIASQGGAPVGPDCPAGSMSSGSQAEKDRENERLPESLQREPEVLQDQWGECSGREEELARQLQEQTDPAVLEAQDLRVWLERDRLQLHSLEHQKETLSLELEDVRVKYARFQEEAALVMADLQREKDDLLSQIEEREKSYEKVALENADLRLKVDALLGEVGPGGPPDPRGPHRLTASTELVVLSHHVSHCYSKTQYPDYCIQSASGVVAEPVVMSDSDGNPLATKEIFRQLRREHSLLRDVMLILYRRRWFVDDAVPYVRRTLRKCGAKLDPLD